MVGAGPAATTTAPLDADLNALAALPGEPRIVSAAGITRGETPLLTIENRPPFDPASARLRLVIVGGLDGDPRSAAAAVDARAMAEARRADEHPRSLDRVGAADGRPRRPRAREAVSLSLRSRASTRIAEQPESRYVWRWVTYQAPDLVIEFRGEPAADASRTAR